MMPFISESEGSVAAKGALSVGIPKEMIEEASYSYSMQLNDEHQNWPTFS